MKRLSLRFGSTPVHLSSSEAGGSFSQDFRREAHIWALVPPHPNVLPLIGIYFRDGDRKRGLISPLASGDLMSSLQNEEHRTYRERFQLVNLPNYRLVIVV